MEDEDFGDNLSVSSSMSKLSSTDDRALSW